MEKSIKRNAQTSFWKNIVVPSLMKRAKNKCQICNSKKHLDTHHWRYDRQTIRDMNVLCKKCHRAQHIKQSEKSMRRELKKLL